MQIGANVSGNTIDAMIASAQQLEQATLAELNEVISNGIAEAELQKVKNARLMALYNDLETINGQANNLGTYEVFFGDFRALFEAPQRFADVTADQIKSVAANYLARSNRTVGVLAANEAALYGDDEQ